MVTCSNFVAMYGIREGRIIEWDVSRLSVGMAKVNFASGDYTSGGVSVSGLLQAAVNIQVGVPPLVAGVIDTSDGIKTVDWDYNLATQKLKAYNAISGRVEVASGQIALSGQSVVLIVVGAR